MTKYPKFVASHPKVNELYDLIPFLESKIPTFDIKARASDSSYDSVLGEKTLILEFDVNEHHFQIRASYTVRNGWEIIVEGGDGDDYFSQALLQDPAFLPKPLETYKTQSWEYVDCSLTFATFPPDAKTIDVANALELLIQCFAKFQNENENEKKKFAIRIFDEKNEHGGTKYGLKDWNTGKIIIPAKYDDFGYGYRYSRDSFSEDDIIHVKLDDKWGWIDLTGKEVIPFKYEKVEKFFYGLSLVKLDGKYGWIDAADKEIIPFKYERAENFHYGLACVSLYGKYGWIDAEGNEIISIIYDEVFKFSRGRVRVKINGKNGLIDTEGNEIIPVKYDFIQEIFDKAYYVVLDHKCGLFDNKGNELVPIGIYDDILACNDDGWVVVQKDGKWGVVDHELREQIPCKYDRIGFYYNQESGIYFGSPEGKIEIDDDGFETFKTEYTKAKLDGKYGLITRTDKVLIPFEYNSIKVPGFYDDIFLCNDDKWGYGHIADDEFVEVFPCKYDAVHYVGKGCCEVSLDGKYGIYWSNGAFVPCIYDYIVFNVRARHAKVVLNNKLGIIGIKGDIIGKIIIPIIYDDINFNWEDDSVFDEEYIEVEKDGDVYAINIHGERVDAKK